MDLHLSVTHQVRKESIGFPYPKRFVESFEKKSLKKSNIPEARQILKTLSVAISSRIVSFQFLPISKHLQTTQGSQNSSIRSSRTICNWRKKFRLSQKENFLESIEKNPYVVN